MKCIFKWIFFTFALASFSPILYAWNAMGHMVIASIAYQQLKPNVRNEIDSLVDYLHREYPEINNFEQLSYWPDAIRSQKIETYTHWHYIDVAFSNDGSPLKNVIDTDNAVWAIKNIQRIIKNNKANRYERARFLAFLTHIVGDLHQPLHTVTHISAKHPDGDKGGNLFYIVYQNKRMSLHRLWDGGVGLFENNENIVNVKLLANTIAAHYLKAYFSKKVDELDPNQWIKEGEMNAKQYVYNTIEEQPLSFFYLEMGKQLTEQQVALAGYRLSALLNVLIET